MPEFEVDCVLYDTLRKSHSSLLRGIERGTSFDYALRQIDQRELPSLYDGFEGQLVVVVVGAEA